MNGSGNAHEEGSGHNPPQSPEPVDLPASPETPSEAPSPQKTEAPKPEAKILGFNRNVFYLGIVSLLNDTASEIIYPLVPLFLKTVLGPFFGLIIGVVEGIAEGTASLMKLFSGWYSDTVKKNKVFVFVGYTFSVVMRPLISLLRYIPSPYYLLFVRFSDRVGKGIRTAPRDALIARSVSENQRGKAFGFHRAMDHFGAVIGPLIAFSLIWLFGVENHGNLSWIFLVAFIPGIFSLYVIRSKVTEVAKEPSPVAEPEEEDEEKKPKLTLAGFDSRFKLFLLILAMFSLGNSSDMFLLLKIGNIGEIGLKVTLVWAAFHVVKSALSTPAGMLSDWLGRKKVIIAGWVLYAVVYFGFAFVKGAEAAWVLFLLYGAYYALTEGVAKALVADYAPEDMRGTAFGWYHFVEGITLIPASIIFGALFYAFGEKTGFPVAFSFGAVLSLGAAVLLALFVPDKPEGDEEEETPSGPEEPSDEESREEPEFSGESGSENVENVPEDAGTGVEDETQAPPEEPLPEEEPPKRPPEKNPYGNDPYGTKDD